MAHLCNASTVYHLQFVHPLQFHHDHRKIRITSPSVITYISGTSLMHQAIFIRLFAGIVANSSFDFTKQIIHFISKLFKYGFGISYFRFYIFLHRKSGTIKSFGLELFFSHISDGR
jgi:hypothetical protein